ncbi:CPP1-like family protein [Myxosarcina sp. GI1]|uniref:CPP1-like family protein n=1 Tax=Myxosarcina sp. GI1 TaxID=1541065 RepID=UPI00056AD4DD|nr:CPP1-like family protein [Myxosarcina sp. GI1]
MSEQNPYEQLGVNESASFEEIQAAKKRLYEKHGNDSNVLEKVETAYDSIIMDRLKLRQEGKIKVPEKIRFPDREREKPSIPVPTINTNAPDWLGQFLDNPSKTEILLPSAVFLVLVSIAVFSQNNQASALPLLMALGFIASFYFLNRKENRSGRAVLMSLAALLLGIAIGTASANLAVNLDANQSAAVVTFCLYWLASCFLR